MTVFRSMGPLWQRDSYTCTKASTVHALDKYLLNRRLNFLKELYHSFNIVRMERWYYFHIFEKGTTILFQYQRRVPPQWCSTFSGSLSNSMETTSKFYPEQFLSVLHLSSIIIFRTIGDMKNAYICVKVVSFDEVNMVHNRKWDFSIEKNSKSMHTSFFELVLNHHRGYHEDVTNTATNGHRG